ncbi:degV family protein [Butyrivibrio proteoclasticus B316]|uniref:DegV family protein n=1 Tax=Butyrivibrio proteoclasticus (strain ATCC 51982 / DSM 14932 / B316) TaxID=515622 RepID=E0S1Y8_BUTPB|nr:DegV family protein [Butyrivibrio proteoclasticus]ADL33813.1 degV family protein [Butyrivibrio proteoclasticus B316]
MSNYILSCCSTADLDEQHLNERDIKYICFHFQLNDKDYPDDLGKSISFKDFYDSMAKGAMTKTSQVSVGEYTEYFESFLKDGKDILHATLSSGISGTLNSATIARDQLKDKYPDRKIYVVDSLAASAGYGLLMNKLADLRDQGMGIDDLYQWTIDHRLECQHWFFVSDLKYLIRGGRVSKVAGAIGSVLNICPLMNVDYQGRLIVRAKVRGKSAVIKAQVEKMVQLATNGLDYDGDCYISNSDCYEDARAVADLIEEKFPKMKGKVKIYSIGTTIGSHTGPGTVALFFWGSQRVD